MKLLRVLEIGEMERVGSSKTKRVDVRIISATNANLDVEVRENRFRQDLLFRLNVLNLHVPPLRERPGDILPLAQFFLGRACAQASRAPMRLSQAACAAMLANPWVGNIRQLQNVIFRAVTMTEGNIINVGDLELAQEATPSLPGEAGDVASLEQAVADFEKTLLQRLYREFPSSRRLAKRLNTSHSAIAKRLRRYGIS